MKLHALLMFSVLLTGVLGSPQIAIQVQADAEVDQQVLSLKQVSQMLVRVYRLFSGVGPS